MSNFTQWQEAKKNLREARLWHSNKAKIDSQDKKPYKFVPLQAVAMQYCGQYSAGANNYHKSPEVLSRYIAEVITDKHEEIIGEAISMMARQQDRLAIEAEGEVDEMLAEIKHISCKDSQPF